jgi:hypothetical protein
MRVAQKDSDPKWGTALPRFFSTQTLRDAVRNINKAPEVGYFDHALIYHSLVQLGGRVSAIESVCIEHHENQSIEAIVRKFVMFYGGGLTDFFHSNKSLAIGRIVPRRVLLRKELLMNPRLLLALTGLYCLKACSGVAGLFLGGLGLLKSESS